KRLDPGPAQAGELRPPLGEQLRLRVLASIGLAHRASLSTARLGSLDFGDLELALRTARHLDGDNVATLVADEGLPDRRFVRELALRGVRLRRAHDLELLRVAGLLVLDMDPDADADGLGVELLLVDDGRAADALLELRDALLEQGLLVLGVVVLGVLHDVAELARLLDARGNLAALGGRQVSELLAELLEPFLSDQ